MKPGNFIWCLLFVAQVNAQEPRLQRSTIPVIDGAYSNKQLLLTAGLSNFSKLTRLKSFAAAIELESTYLLKEARLFTAMIVQPVDRSMIGLTIAHNASPDFRQSTVSLLLSRNLGNIQLGGEFLFHYTAITGYPSAGNMDAGICFRVELSPAFNAGFRLRNLSGFFIKNEKRYTPVIHAGAGYDISDAVQLGGEWLQETGYATIITTGLIYRFHRLLLLIAGFNWSPCQPYGGFQFHHNHWSLFFKTSFHPSLGWSPSVGISFGTMKNDPE